MTDDEAKEIWDDQIREVAIEMQHATQAGAVLIAVFDGPWMGDGDPAAMGLIGTQFADPFRIARNLRTLAGVLEKNGARIEQGETFVHEGREDPPVRD